MPETSLAATAAVDAEVFTLPTSPGQRRLWFLEHLQPGRPLYNVPIAVRMTGSLNADSLEQALNDVVERHEVLRTSFAQEGEHPVQVVSPAMNITLVRTDLADLPVETRQAQAKRLTCEAAQQPFDLQSPPLLRAHLLRLDDADHVFVIIVHHIIFDGWSLKLLFRELSACYEARRTGCVPDLPELPVQYGDFAVWQHERIKANPLWIEWWKGRLAGSPPALELPTDHPRPPVHSGRGRIEIFPLPAGIRGQIERLGRREHVTVFMTLLAAFQALLHRYTGQEDILVGTPVAGRIVPETETLIGLFINTLVVRGDLSGNPTFRELLARVRSAVLAALDHEEAPFEKLVESLRPERDLSRSPLFQVMVLHEHAPLENICWPGLELAQLDVDNGTAKFDLSLYIVESAGSLTIRAEYNSDLHEPATIRRLLKHYSVLLEEAITDPDRRIAHLQLLNCAERTQILAKWNRTESDYARDQTAHGLIAAQAARSPDAIALESGDHEMTYRQLNQESDRFARCLRGVGVRPGALVGLCVDRSPATLVALLGILKAGGAYLPLDPTHPSERLAYMLADSGAPVVVTQHIWEDLLPQTGVKRIFIDDDWPAPRGTGNSDAGPAGARSGRAPEARQKIESSLPAYVIYTSGSTGTPKAVVISHRALVNLLCSMRRTPGLTCDDVLLSVTTLSFDIAALELLLPLTVGARVVLAAQEESGDAAWLSERLAEGDISAMQATPALWRMLLCSGWPGSPKLRVFCGGEALSRDLADELAARCAELWNLYGPTETTIWSSAARVSAGPDPIVIGRPVANTQLHVLDAHLEPVPFGVPGELVIGGDGLAVGYLNRAGLTAEKFIPNPFDRATVPGSERLYRTGDLARRRPDGEIELLGRLDHQVKVRGHRIELGEIEAALRRAPSVRDAVVTVHESEPGDRRLVAYIAGDPGDPRNVPSELRIDLRHTLPDFMVPTAFIVLESLPMTPNGKVDRNALPEPAPTVPCSATAHEACNDLERRIAEIWTRTLNIPAPGLDDSFFDLGGHSLGLARVQTLLRRDLGLEVSIITLFEHPTIRSLARALDGAGADALLQIEGISA